MSRTLAPDTNLLSRETSRRILVGVTRELGDTLAVLPEVYREARRQVADAAQTRWIRRLKDDQRYSPAEKQQITQAAASAATRGFVLEVESPQSPFKLLEPGLEDAWAASRIAMYLPRGIVRGEPTVSGDSRIIAEAAVFDVSFLSTNNLKTIWHDRANQWAARTLGRTTSLIYTPHRTLEVLSDSAQPADPAELRYQWMLAYGMRLTGPAASLDAIRTTWEFALTRIAGAGFQPTAQESRWLYEDQSDEAFRRSLAQAVGRKVVEVSAEAETRMSQPIFNAARNAGWDEPPPPGNLPEPAPSPSP